MVFDERVPTAVVYEAFLAVAGRLLGRLAQRHAAAGSAAERAAVRRRMAEVRDARAGTAADDRAALVARIAEWEAEAAETEEGEETEEGAEGEVR